MMRRPEDHRRRRRLTVAGLLVLGMVLVAVAAGFKGLFFSGQPADKAGNSRQDTGNDQASNWQGSGGRKNIYDRNYKELAIGFRRSSLYARPLELEAPEEVARKVAEILGLSEKDILTTLKSERGFVWLGRDLPIEEAAQIADLNLKGIYRIDQVHRYYPWKEQGAHVIGFLKDEQGLAGVEFYYDSILRGGGVYDSRLAAAGIDRRMVEGTEGAHLVLTIDIAIQDLLERKVRDLMVGLGAQSAMAILMVPDTGEIIASASLPAYDPNRFWELGTEERRNRVVEDLVDLGGLRVFFETAALGPPPPSPEEESAPELKTESGLAAEGARPTQPTSWWKPGSAGLKTGIFLSPEALSFGRNDTDDKAFVDFARSLDLTGRTEVDLPDIFLPFKASGHIPREKRSDSLSGGPPADGPPHDQTGRRQPITRATPLALLSSFCRAVNGGRAMSPHVLGAIWPNGMDRGVAVRPKTYGFALRPEQSAALLTAIKGMIPAEADFFAIESLLTEAGPMEQVPVNHAQSEDSGGERTVPVPAKILPTRIGPADSLLLAMEPIDHPEMALLLVLEGGHFVLSEKSPVRPIAGELLRQARAAIQHQAPVPADAELLARSRDYYRQWERSRQTAGEQPLLVRGDQAGVMPKLVGLSLRKALQHLQPHGIRVQVLGSGRVLRQVPAAGSPLTGVDRCLLELQVPQ